MGFTRTLFAGRRRRRGWLAAAALAVTVAGAASLALGPLAAGATAIKPILPAGGVPGGFDTVVAVVPVGAAGKVIAGKLSGVRGSLQVAAGSFTATTDVLVTAADVKAIPPAKLLVPAAKRHDRVVYGLGLLFQRGGGRVASRVYDTVTFSGAVFTKAGYVVVYYAARHAFVPAPRHTALCTTSHCLVKIRTGTEVAVLEP